MTINVKEFVKNYGRMCDTYCPNGCLGCPVDANKNAYAECNRIEKLKYIAPLIQKWAEEHPARTYLVIWYDAETGTPALI